MILSFIAGVQESGRGENVSQSKVKQQSSFVAARYKSLLFGKSKKADVIKLFGRPLSSGLGTDQTLYLYYRDIWLAPGKVEFFVDPVTEIVDGMCVYPDNPTISTITSLIGPDFVITRYDMRTSERVRDGDSGIVSRNPHGEYRMIEYPKRGIVVGLRGERVFDVFYRGVPFGSEEGLK
jgi:hypothetical protein